MSDVIRHRDARSSSPGITFPRASSPAKQQSSASNDALSESNASVAETDEQTEIDHSFTTTEPTNGSENAIAAGEPPNEPEHSATAAGTLSDSEHAITAADSLKESDLSVTPADVLNSSDYSAIELASESDVLITAIERAKEWDVSVAFEPQSDVSITSAEPPGELDFWDPEADSPGTRGHTVIEPGAPSEPDYSVTDFFVEMIARPNPSKVTLGLCRDGFFPYGVNGNDPRIRRLLRHYFPVECPCDDPEEPTNRRIEKDDDAAASLEIATIDSEPGV